jgi:hypothetical protein
MAIDSTADLLFRVSADSTPAQGDLAALRAAVAATFGGMVADSKMASGALLYDWAGRPIRSIADDFTGLGESAGSAARQTMGSTRETREALRGLGEEIGVRMPRFVSGWLASLGPVSGVMSAAFAPIAVIGLVEVLGKIPEALEKGVDWLHGWTAEAKKAFTETTKDALEFQERSIRLNERLRAIALIGKEGMEKWHLEAAINSEDYREVASKIDELNAKLVTLKQTAGMVKAPVKSAAEELGGISLTGETGTKFKAAPPAGPSHEEIEKAKTEVKELEPIIKELTAQLDDLAVKAKEIPAQAAAESAKGVKQSLEDFQGLSQVLEQVRGKLAGMKGEEEKAEEEYVRLAQAGVEAFDKLNAKKKKGDLADGVAERELSSWLMLQQLLPAIYSSTMEEIAAKRAEKAAEAADQIKQQTAAEGVATLATKQAAWDAEIERRALAMQREKTLTVENYDALVTLWKAGREKLQREQAAADEADAAAARQKGERENTAELEREQRLVSTLASLGEQRQRILRQDETTRERITGQYAADAAKFDAAEEKKTLDLAKGEEERTQIAQAYARIRAALLTQEQAALQTLRNSTGWRGVFGNEFAQMIRQNEALTRQWATSTNQSTMMLRVTLEALKETAQKTFSTMAEGMAANIASAIVHKKSIGEAMRAETASVLESLAAKATVYAIYSLAMGFTDIAEKDYAGAAAAFEAAAIWGLVGGAAAVAGRAVAPSQSTPTSTAAGAGASGGASTGGAYAGSGGAMGGGSGSGAHVTVNVWGHVVGTSGISEFASMLNDAVLNSDVQLTATNTKTGRQVTA